VIDTSTLASANLPLFLTKTYEFVDDPRTEHIVAWKDDGRGFVVKDVNKFCDQILNKYFKHSNFSSFIRQLNMYDFKKTRNVQNEKVFSQPSFQRGKKMLLANIQRKKTASEKQVAEANALKAKLTAMEHNQKQMAQKRHAHAAVKKPQGPLMITQGPTDFAIME